MVTNLEMIQAAIKELGATENESLAAFVEKRYGVKIDAKYIPIYRASLVDKRKLAVERAARAAPPPAPA